MIHNCEHLFNFNPLVLQEPNNLKARNSFRFNGLVHKKTVGVQPAADGKGVVVVLKKRRGSTPLAGRFLSFTSFFDLFAVDRFGQTRLEKIVMLMSRAVLLKPFSRCTGQNKPASSYEKITINKNSRATLNSVRHIISKNKYRKDLRMVSSPSVDSPHTILKQVHVRLSMLLYLTVVCICVARLPFVVPALF